MLTDEHAKHVGQYLATIGFTKEERRTIVSLPALRAIQGRLPQKDDWETNRAEFLTSVRNIGEVFRVESPDLATKITKLHIAQVMTLKALLQR